MDMYLEDDREIGIRDMKSFGVGGKLLGGWHITKPFNMFLRAAK